MDDIKAYMVCHTHWDREWYLTREEFRTKLVRLIDGLLELVEQTPEYVSFMLDGQTIAIEDYLEIKPQNRARLFEALKKGKVVCGPWYILPDELLVSGEAHIRNFLMGTKVVAEAGKKMETAYLPDSFGHPAQMPQIVKGLGMNAMVFWRGVPRSVTQTEFYWESPDPEARIFCLHMPYGYGNSANLNDDMAVTLPRIQKLMEDLHRQSSTDLVLLMNGSDHIVGQKNITDIVEYLNRHLENGSIELSTLEQFLERLQKSTCSLPTFRGEFRSGQRSMLLGGTLSARMYLKQRNDRVQNKAERYLEPMLVLERLSGGRGDSQAYMGYLWKKILENHPHDSICGCSIDAVHREMMTRFDCVEQLEDTLMRDLAARNERPRAQEPGRRARLLLFEPTTAGQPFYTEADVCLDSMLVQETNFAESIINDYEGEIVHPDMPLGIRITDEAGREIPYVVLDKKKDYETRYQDHTSPEIYKVNKLRIGMLLPAMAFGFHQLFVEPSGQALQPVTEEEGRGIENEFYRIEAEEGALTVWEKKTGRRHKGFGRLVDLGDVGDEYTYSWPKQDTEYSVKSTGLTVKQKKLGSLCQKLCLEGRMELPASAGRDRSFRSTELLECPFRMEVSLYQGINRIDCHLEFENRARDHRLQVEIPSGILAQSSGSYDIFHITERPVEVEVPNDWMEYPQSTHPTHGYMEIHGQDARMAVGARGLTEYEAVQTGQETMLRLTLLRCVGWLSRTDLLTRKGNGGWTIETPEAQCQGRHSFDFCVIYQEKQLAEAFGAVERFRLPPYIQMVQSNNILFDRPDLDFVNLLPDDMKLSALKIPENQEGIILRFYSIAEENRCLRLPVPGWARRVYETNLAEERKQELEIDSGYVELQVRGKQIVTLNLQ